MLHHYVILHRKLSGAHWAVGKNNSCVLLQVNDGFGEARIKLTPAEAIEVAKELLRVAAKSLLEKQNNRYEQSASLGSLQRERD